MPVRESRIPRPAQPAAPAQAAAPVRTTEPAPEPPRAFPHAHVFGPTHVSTPARTPAHVPSRVPARVSARKPRKGPSRWTSLGVGLTVAVATTTTLTAIAPQAMAPEGDDQPTTGALESITAAAQAAVDDRDGAASRSGARSDAKAGAKAAAKASTVRTGAGGAAQITVSDQATMSVETLDGGEIEAAPPVLPGCSGEATGSGSNGLIASSELCTLWDGHTRIRADAAVALAELNEAYQAVWGEPMCITDGFRSYSQQVATKAAKGYLAAPPGTSNHGWGLAVDICPETYAGSRWAWLAANAPAFGWDNPDWARPGGSKYEPWHWEFTDAVARMG